MMGSVMGFVVNVPGFPAVKELENSLRNDKLIAIVFFHEPNN